MTKLPLTVFCGLALALSVGCLRNYNVTPLNPAQLTAASKADPGLEVKFKGFLSKEEIADKFGPKLAEDREVIPVYLALSNKGQESFRVLRASLVLEETSTKNRLGALSLDQMYENGRHGYGKPVCGMIFGGVLGLPSLITTITSNNKIRDDYSQKLIQDAILEPGKEVSGSVFFDPTPLKLTRKTGKYKLLVDLENTKTKDKVLMEAAL